jgi:predicted RNA-binding protein YlqC (UPF0109 family)
VIKELVEYVIGSLVEHPDQVRVVEVRAGGGNSILELSVAAADMGRVIGKGGRIINSLRTLAQAAAAREGQRVSLELIEAEDGPPRR